MEGEQSASVKVEVEVEKRRRPRMDQVVCEDQQRLCSVLDTRASRYLK